MSSKVFNDESGKEIEVPEGMTESDVALYKLMVEASRTLADIPDVLAGTVSVVVRSENQRGFCPMILNFVCRSNALKGDDEHVTARALIALYVDQLAAMVTDVRDGSLKSTFADVLESAAAEMREVDAPMKGFLSN